MNACKHDKIPLVVVGLNFGRHIVRGLSEPAADLPVRLVGLCDLEQKKAESLAAQYGNLRVYTDLDEVLADPAVAAVGLFTGPVGRAGLICRIVEAGKDVMTTKPFETDPDTARAALDLAVKLSRTVHLNSPNPGITPDLAAIRAWRERFDLGQPVAARAEAWVSYREQADGSWYDDPERCPAAPITRLGVYVLNDLTPLLGTARRVSAFSSRLFTQRPTADNAQLSIEYENGALATIFASFCVGDGDAYRNSLTLNFERGTIYRNVGPARSESDGVGSDLTVITSGPDGRGRHVADTTRTAFCSGQYDWEGFARAVRGEPDAPRYAPEHIVEPLRVLAAMAESERTGTIQTLHR